MTEKTQSQRIPYPAGKLVTEPANPEFIVEDDEETIALSQNPNFWALIEESRQSLRENGGIPLEEVKKMFDLDWSPEALVFPSYKQPALEPTEFTLYVRNFAHRYPLLPKIIYNFSATDSLPTKQFRELTKEEGESVTAIDLEEAAGKSKKVVQ